mmetsp:Transcript_24254/g.34712  ORF Transcript_24254/g.34712 Transcript_24254/m.34712 type:complete len:81 (+) Transcript_24254:788-1030(+)
MIAIHKGSETNSFDIVMEDYRFQPAWPEECKPGDSWDGLVDADMSYIVWNFSSYDEDEKFAVVVCCSMIFHYGAELLNPS